MPTIIKSLIALILVQVALTANAMPLQQTPGNFIVKGSLSDGIPYDMSQKERGYVSNVASREGTVMNNIKAAPVIVEKDAPALIARDTSFMQIDTKLRIAAERLKQNTASLADYVRDNDFNTEYCFLIDMSIPSGKKRFFIYNIKKDVVEYSSLVSHGSGSYRTGCNDELTFSNLANSDATSLGRYKIGNAYYGTYGLSYKLYGLDSTNCNALQRSVVLHSSNYIPETETYPRHIFESAGCPAVSPFFLTELTKYIKSSDKPIMLWIYK